MHRLIRASVVFTSLSLLACGNATEETEVFDEELSDLSEQEFLAQGTAGLSGAELRSVLRGADVYLHEKFDGNGRTCVTCHTLRSGTLNPAEVQSRFRANPNQPLFRSLDSDNGTGSNYSKLLRDATVNVTLDLPPNVYIAEKPAARTVKIRRGIPSNLDMPALDPFIMLDIRAPSLQEQARGAINDHARARRQPTAQELDDVALFQQKLLFSSAAQARHANGGPAPELPMGTTASEQRGRAFFSNPEAICAVCHTGQALNGETGTGDVFARGSTVLVTEFNRTNRPVLTYVWVNDDGTETRVQTPDPGVALTFNFPDAAGAFKMVSLRNIKNTAPYFHDNSAKTLNQLMDHYQEILPIMFGVEISNQDKADLVAFMKLL